MSCHDSSPVDSWPAPAPRRRFGHSIRLHALLFVATLLTTFYIGSQGGVDPAGGAVYALTIVAILGAHEMGHYLTCVAYRVPATLPYFVPLPLPPFGTLGAVIRMAGPVCSRHALFDIAVAGPLAGLVVAVPALIVGLHHSQVTTEAAPVAGQMFLGSPLLLDWLADAIVGARGSDATLVLHPMAFAGWAGLFVTSLNLLPAGQLDGGHVIHALIGARSRYVTIAVVIGLGVLCAVTRFFSWLIVAALIVLVARRHPPTLEDDRGLGAGRIAVGLAMIVVFALCFTPVPIRVG